MLANRKEIETRNLLQGKLEFRTLDFEVQLVAKLQPRNLVRLLGFSLAGEERIFNLSIRYLLYI